MNAVDALAESWASLDGKLELYWAERDGKISEKRITGTYEGYQAEACELIKRINKRDFEILEREL